MGRQPIGDRAMTGAERQRRSRVNRPTKLLKITIDVDPALQEDVVWRERLAPHMQGIPENVIDVCRHGFNEMLNNVIDHSGSDKAIIGFERSRAEIKITIRDRGVGVFEKVRSAFNLHDRRQALLELSKGKLTTDKTRHSGEGIFFTSRAFDRFKLISHDLLYSRSREHDWGWLVEASATTKKVPGTVVEMAVATNAVQTVEGVFADYSVVDDGVSHFTRTHVHLILAKYEGDKLVSRSQAKRLMSRVENFAEVLLDFKGIDSIGQGFADEVFRVWQSAHPSVNLVPMYASDLVDRMIKRVRTGSAGG